jgi:hypothetical protein
VEAWEPLGFGVDIEIGWDKEVGVYFPERIENGSVILPEVDSHHLPKTLSSKNQICRSV